ncbi:MAG: phage tail sheath subtilisin-like domain-containing protein [Oscillospiraceae bacterium]
MAEYLSPGVYVEEFDSGSVPMEGVSTSTAGFVGVTEKGPVDGAPVLVTNFADFRRTFGGYLTEREFGEYRYLAYSVNQFFTNGGSRCFIKRVVPANAKYAGNTEDTAAAPVVIFAKDPGAWGNKITVKVAPASKFKTQILELITAENGTKYRVKNASGFSEGDLIAFTDGSAYIENVITSIDGDVISLKDAFDGSVVDTNLVPTKIISTVDANIEVSYDGQVEKYEFVSLNVATSDFITMKLAKSELIAISVTVPENPVSVYELFTGRKTGDEVVVNLFGGTNGTADALSAADFMGEDKGPGNRTGIQAFIDNGDVSIMAVPGVTDANVQMALVAHCENMGSRFAILDIARDTKSVNDIIATRNIFDTSYAAMYHPWVKVFDPVTKNTAAIPPSGSIAGIYARTDNTRGVWKAPANEVVSGCVGLDCNYTTGEQDLLNPKGINLIRSFPGQGIKVWGARTLSSNGQWKYINVRRLFIFLEESIKANTNWVVFEPNDQVLWLRVKRTIEVFLAGMWRNGAFTGSAESEAFFVDIGPNTMSKDDIDNGRLICVIGVAPVKPAEFVVFRLTQKTAEQ